MRTVFQESLDTFANDLIALCDLVAKALNSAGRGLLECDLQESEDALSLYDEIEELIQACNIRAVQLLALEAPVARDLRQVVSSIHIVKDAGRMSALAMHIARTARRRHPQSAIPEPIHPYFVELSRLCLEMVEKVREILVDPDADAATILEQDDDAVDDIHAYLMTILTTREWPYSTKEAVDVTLLTRYYERFADHAVNVAAQIIFLTSGLNPEDYLAKRRREDEEAEFSRAVDHLEAQFRNKFGTRFGTE